MQVVFKLVVLGVVALVVANYVFYQKTGEFLARDWPAREWMASAKSELIKIVDNNAASEAGTVKISKWTDANGVVHYENRPVEGAKTIDVDPNANVLPPMPSVKLPKNTDVKPKAMDEELSSIQEAKRAHFDALTQ